MRVGIGFDIHRFVEGKPLLLGGVEIPHPQGLLGHSDADVLLHALCDALLGAAGLGDMGAYFPDTDPKWKGVPSHTFVLETLRLLGAKNLAPANVDLIVVAESPKLGPHRRVIQKSIAAMLGLPEEDVNLKAKTMEGLGPIGENLAVAAYAVAMLK